MKFSSRSVSRGIGGGLRAASFASYAVCCFRYLDEMEIDRQRNGTSLPIILERGPSMVTARNSGGKLGLSASADPRSQGQAPAAMETFDRSSQQPIITTRAFIRRLVHHREYAWNDLMLSRVRQMSLPPASAAKWMAPRIKVLNILEIV